MPIHNMTSMKLTSEEKKHSDLAVHTDREYPWGLQINLEKESLEKLSMDLKDIGTELTFKIITTVTDISQNLSESDSHKTMGIQITDMELISNDSNDAAKKLYGDD